MIVYGVIESEYDYDDQTYTRAGYSKPHTLYKSKEKAEEALEEKEREFYRSSSARLYDFSEDLEGIITKEGIEKLVELYSILSIQNELNIKDFNPDDPQCEDICAIFEHIVNNIEWSLIQDLVKEILIRPFELIEVFLDTN